MGHRKDINEYSEIKPEVFERMQELKAGVHLNRQFLTGLEGDQAEAKIC